MENGEKKEVIQENPAVTDETLDEDSFAVQDTRNSFYGGADLRLSRIKVISDKPVTIE